jgi:tetratricopeptide (TPR) repeat protein/predicted Ser/Thr protein kinase
VTDDPRVQQLLEELQASDSTPEVVCELYPELLPAVRKQWRRIQRLRADLDALFPAPDEPTPLPNGTDLPHVPGYEVEAVLGRGGMGIVFQARHLRLNRPVALKMVLAGAYADPLDLARFQREAEAAAGLRHPNIVQVYDVGESNGRPFFTMEYIEGGSLAKKLAGTPQLPQQAAQILVILAGAVQAAHDKGIVHRDLKPSNVLLTADEVPKISDFGLARRFEGEAGITRTGAAVGTPSYMAPEQARGEPYAVGPAADVYALGAILYELLTGRPPFRAATATETVQQVISQEPAPPSRLNDKVPRDLETICLKCLHKEPGRRYASALALADDLRRFGAGLPILARPVGRGERLWRWGRRNPMAAGLLASFLGLLILTIAVGFWFDGQRAERQGRAREAVEAALAQLPALRQQGRWPEAQAVLQQARSRLDDAGSVDLQQRLARAEEDLQLAATLEHIRLTPAIDGNRFDYPGMAEAYARAFEQAGLDIGRDKEDLAAQIRASDLRPQLVTALDHWAYVADARGDRQLMSRLLDLARRAHPDPEWGDHFRAVEVWQNPEALRRLAAAVRERLAKESLENGPPAMLLALLAKNLGQKDEQAELLLRDAQRQRPEDFWLNYALGEALLGAKPTEAVGFYRAALVTRPTVAEVHLQLGMALLRQRQLDEAIRACRQASQFAPNFATAHHNLGLCLQAKGRLDEAMTEFRHAIQLLPASNANFIAGAHHNLGMCWEAKDRLDEAMTEYNLAIQFDPKLAIAHHQLAICRHVRGRLDEAMTGYRQAIQLDPKGAPAHYQLGVCYYQRGELDEAVAECHRAHELDPELWQAHQLLSQMLASRGNWAQAAAFCARILKVGPTDNGDFWFEYAALLLLSGDRPGYARACANMVERCSKPGGLRVYHAARACTLAPHAVAVVSLPSRLVEKELQGSREYWSLTEQGALAYRADRFQEAVPLFEQSLKADPDAAPGRAVLNWLWLALANQRLGKAEEAQRWLGKAQAWLDQYGNRMPARAEEELGLGLHNWLEAHLLRREAETVLASMP